MYQALYRTYRPKKFKEVVGQELVVRTLQNSIGQQKISHAYLFSGPRGTGKTSVARIFASTLVCQDTRDSEPCCKCNRCKEIAESSYPDVIELDAASNNGVEQIRDIREKVQFLPSAANYKVYIIDEAHMLTQAAFNALLKVLEEPPKHVIFILATTEPEKLPKTIISRCQRFDFRILTVNEIFTKLRLIVVNEDLNVSDEALIAIAEASEGALRDALSILDQVISYATGDTVEITDVSSVTGNVEYQALVKLATSITRGGAKETLAIAEELYAEGKEISKIIYGLIQLYRDMLLYKNGERDIQNKHIYDYDKFIELAKDETEAKIFYFIEILSEVLYKIKRTPNPRIHFEIALVKMIKARGETIETISRLNALEEKINKLDIEGLTTGSKVSSEEIEEFKNRLEMIVEELNKLEIPKLKENLHKLELAEENRPKINNAYFEGRIDELEQKMLIFDMSRGSIGENITNANSEEVELIDKKVGLLQEKFDIIEKKVYSVDSDLSKLKLRPQEIDTSVYDKLDQLELLNKRLEILESRFERDYQKAEGASGASNSETVESLLSEISVLKSQIQTNSNNTYKYNGRINELEEKFNDLKNVKISRENTRVDDDLLERIQKLEKEFYRFASGELYDNSPIKQKQAKKTSIVNRGNEYENLSEFQKAVDPKVNFGELSKTSEESLNEKRRLEEIKRKEEMLLIEEKQKRIEEENALREKELKLKQLEKEQREAEIRKAEEILQMKEKAIKEKQEAEFMKKKQELAEVEALKERETQEKLEALEKEKERIQTELEETKARKQEAIEALRELENKKEEQVVKPIVKNSELVIKDKTNSTIVADNKPENIENKDLWFYKKYSIKYIEKILNDASSQEARDEKKRVLSIFQNDLGANFDVALPGNGNLRILKNGTPVAANNGKMILVFGDITNCNLVMEPEFYETATGALYRVLGAGYEYLALPQEAWEIIRKDYRNQFANGTQKPILKPFKFEGLIDLTKFKKEKTEVEEAREVIASFFDRKE